MRRIGLEWHARYELDDLLAVLTDAGFREVQREAGEGGRGMLWLERDEPRPA